MLVPESLPRLDASITYVYIERAVIERDENAIVVVRTNETVHIPIASITTLFIGPGTTITHAAISVIVENGCMIIWCGEGATKFYASGSAETSSSSRILKQAEMYSNQETRLEVVRLMYQLRFNGLNLQGKTLNQMMGMEGARVKEAYNFCARQYNVRWIGRNTGSLKEMGEPDLVNQLLTVANSYLYGICHSAIVTLGYSPAIGFIHTGNMKSFVYDVADFYKVQTTIPTAFSLAAKNCNDFATLRQECRKFFTSEKLLKRVAKDIEYVLNLDKNEDCL